MVEKRPARLTLVSPFRRMSVEIFSASLKCSNTRLRGFRNRSAQRDSAAQVRSVSADCDVWSKPMVVERYDCDYWNQWIVQVANDRLYASLL
jgi:hypothetical protein